MNLWNRGPSTPTPPSPGRDMSFTVVRRSRTTTRVSSRPEPQPCGTRGHQPWWSPTPASPLAVSLICSVTIDVIEGRGSFGGERGRSWTPAPARRRSRCSDRSPPDKRRPSTSSSGTTTAQPRSGLRRRDGPTRTDLSGELLIGATARTLTATFANAITRPCRASLSSSPDLTSLAGSTMRIERNTPDVFDFEVGIRRPACPLGGRESRIVRIRGLQQPVPEPAEHRWTVSTRQQAVAGPVGISGQGRLWSGSGSSVI